MVCFKAFIIYLYIFTLKKNNGVKRIANLFESLDIKFYFLVVFVKYLQYEYPSESLNICTVLFIDEFIAATHSSRKKNIPIIGFLFSAVYFEDFVIYSFHQSILVWMICATSSFLMPCDTHKFLNVTEVNSNALSAIIVSGQAQ